MTRRIVLFLIRKKLGLKKGQAFQFANQKSSTDYYYFSEYYLWKVIRMDDDYETGRPSSVSLMWLLEDNCKIKKLEV